uniref:Uncharacterized protein n=2 Tax=Hemiselmis andersenii TaxID=464988 RepID=A0A7S0TUN7_HEMAN
MGPGTPAKAARKNSVSGSIAGGHLDEEQGVGDGGEMDTWEEEDEAQAPELDGDDPSMWRYQRTHLGSQDDPEKREFYLFQVRLPDHVVDTSRAYRVTISSKTLPDRPSHTFDALEADEQGRILFPRAQFDGQIVETTALSPADDLTIVNMPYDLLGHTLDVEVHDAVTSELLHTRSVEYRMPVAHPSTLARTPISSPGPKLPARPMTYRLSPSRLHNQSSYSSAGSPTRPSTAPSPGGAQKHHGTSSAAHSRPASRGSLAGSPSKWNSHESAYDPDALDEGSLSPRERKRQELARVRAQMKASLQQTQNQAMAAVQATRGNTRLMSAGQLRSPNESLLGLGQESFAGSAAPPMIVSQAPTNKVGPRPGSSMREIRSP